MIYHSVYHNIMRISNNGENGGNRSIINLVNSGFFISVLIKRLTFESMIKFAISRSG